ncbi:hypothetical protein AMECASPLE_011366 [Ameca splendens]|uniref:Transmembrane protein n=1 Tax=Ameca splendens TaxID=208324 RepID=A0ABV0ZLP9_9TELE
MTRERLLFQSHEDGGWSGRDGGDRKKVAEEMLLVLNSVSHPSWRRLYFVISASILHAFSLMHHVIPSLFPSVRPPSFFMFCIFFIFISPLVVLCVPVHLSLSLW